MLATLAALLCLPSLPAADPQDSTTLQSRVPSIPTLIADLKSSVPDPRPRDALNTLLSFGEPAVAPLSAALDSPNYLQRQLAAAALRAMDGFSIEGESPFSPDTPPPKITPTPALLRVCIEGLKDDTLPGVSAGDREYDQHPIIFNAASGTRFLIKHAARAEPLLADALKSPDLQQRFCAAIILGFAARPRHAETICAILIPHLRDNSIRGDALWASCALYHLGHAAELHLLAASLRPVDQQQRELLALILSDIRDPLPCPAASAHRAAPARAILKRGGPLDPLLTFDQYSLQMEWGSAMTERNRDTPRAAMPTPIKSANMFTNIKHAD